MESITFQDVLGKKVLITGDIGTGKTQLTLQLLDEAIMMGFGDDITIIDMAPTSRYVNTMKVGGKLSEYSSQLESIRYFTPTNVETPRLSAQSPQELQHLVSLNERRIRPHLENFIQAPSPILCLNDVSIYLQSGLLKPVFRAIQVSKTCVANGYYGQALRTSFDDSISSIERTLMDQLSNGMDLIIRL